jgi:hypothetical protein
MIVEESITIFPSVYVTEYIGSSRNEPEIYLWIKQEVVDHYPWIITQGSAKWSRSVAIMYADFVREVASNKIVKNRYPGMEKQLFGYTP